MSTGQEIKSAIEQLSSFAKAMADRPLEERAALITEPSEFWNANPR